MQAFAFKKDSLKYPRVPPPPLWVILPLSIPKISIPAAPFQEIRTKTPRAFHPIRSAARSVAPYSSP